MKDIRPEGRADHIHPDQCTNQRRSRHGGTVPRRGRLEETGIAGSKHFIQKEPSDSDPHNA
ncbi:MAG: hypothetical protein JRC68_08510 [Deltaproteobacteria bacterium]|nr:hypothetical protein [Deltaproteobacteria bacterium]